MKVRSVRHTIGVFSKMEEDKWETHREFYADIETDAGVISLVVDAGFRFNFRSGPRYIPFLPKIGKAWLAWLVHDALYETECSQELADEIMYEILLRCGVYRWAAWLAMKAVNAFGEDGYEQKDQKNRVAFHWIHRPTIRNWDRLL